MERGGFVSEGERVETVAELVLETVVSESLHLVSEAGCVSGGGICSGGSFLTIYTESCLDRLLLARWIRQ